MSISKEPVRIIWHGHSCFEIRSEGGTVVIDPYEEVPGYAPLDLKADLVLVSHEHGDHNARERVELSGRKSLTDVEVLDTFHDDAGGTKRGSNKIHIVTIDGKRIAHLGDLGHTLEPGQLERLRNLDVLLIPVGGHYTIDADTAAAIVKQVRPDVTVPMHYREGSAGFDVISTVQPFLDHFEKVKRLDESSVEIGHCHDCIVVMKNPTG